jgi:hypothetical protein
MPIDVDPIFWARQKIEMLPKKFPMKGFSFNTLKNLGCKRRECGVLETAIYHMQVKTQILWWNHSITTLSKFCIFHKKNLHGVEWIGSFTA